MARFRSDGPYHPVQEEPEFFKLTVDGERVVAVDAEVGYNHRGVEKLSEMKTFDQSTFVSERICGPGDFLATIYHHLGIDSSSTLIRDFNGRPTPIVDHGKPIPELVG